MYCPACGTLLSENQQFCPRCGERVQPPEQPIPQPAPLPDAAPVKPIPAQQFSAPSPTPGGLSKRKIIVLAGIAVAVLVLIVAVVIAVSAGSGQRKMTKALEDGDLYTISSVYNELISDGKSDDARKAMVGFVQDAADTLNSDFSYDISNASGEWDIEDYMYEDYIPSTWGDILSDEGQIWISGIGYQPLDQALEDFCDLADSKISYYIGLYYLDQGDSASDYEDAAEAFGYVIAADKNFSDAEAKMDEAYDAYLSAVITLADEHIADGDFAGALELLDQELDVDNAELSEQMQTKLNETRKSYADQYAQKAADALKSGDAEGAVGNMEAAVQICPDGGYQAKLDEYKLYLPYALYDQNNILQSDTGIELFDSAKAVNQEEYTNIVAVCYTENADPIPVSYMLNGNYDTVTGTFFSPKENATFHRTGSVYFEAYGDGKLLFTSPTISAESLPTDIQFSVTGVQKLEIRFIGSGSSVRGVDAIWTGDYGMLSNLIAQKNIPQT